MTNVPILAEKVAVVTGAASGIGLATAAVFLEAGASVLLVDQDERQLGKALGSLGSCAEGRLAQFVGDVSDPATAEAAIDEGRRLLGGIDILVNNAGINPVGTVLETTVSEWDRVFAVNVRSVYLLSRLAIPLMRERGGGQIVNTASEAGLVGTVGFAAYSASKSAVINLTRSMAADHAREGVRVNCVCPGPIQTPLLQRFYDAQADPAMARAEEERSHFLGLGTPEDVAEGILYLSSPRSRYVTGHALAIDGGFTAV